MNNKNQALNQSVLKLAFHRSLPILTGYTFLGFTYGIYMNASGFSFLYPMIMAMVIYGGSLEFVAVSMLLSPFAPVEVFILTLLIQARHLFYGLSMLEKYRNTGWRKFYLIYGLTDETFAINYSQPIPENVDKSKYLFLVTLFNHCYWVIGATLGGLVGTLLNFNLKGINFIMTAMFVVIFVDQWQKERSHISSFIGIGVSLLCLNIFGAQSFMIPTMVGIVLVLALMRKHLSHKKTEDC